MIFIVPTNIANIFRRVVHYTEYVIYIISPADRVCIVVIILNILKKTINISSDFTMIIKGQE